MKIEYDKTSIEELLKNNKNLDIIVSKEQFEEILKNIGNKIDDEQYITEVDTNERSISQDNDEIKIDELGGIFSGSKTFIKKNVVSFSEYLIEKEKML